MAHILHINSSPRSERSHSRKLSYEFITAWKTTHPNDTVTYRDLGHHPIPHVDESWIAAAFSPPEIRTPELDKAIYLSNVLIDEFLAADLYVFGVPMYNFSVPSTFKAYIDQIIRPNRTYVMNNGEYKGLVNDKKMLIITARAESYGLETPMASYDFQEPFLRTIFSFIGITDVKFIHAENLAAHNDVREQSLAKASAMLKEAVASW